MNLYFFPDTCSLAANIALREASLGLELDRWPALQDFHAHVGTRPHVKEAHASER